MDDMLFCNHYQYATDGWSSPAPGQGPVVLWCQVVKDLPISRGHALGAPLLIAQSSAHSAGPRSGRRNTEWKEWKVSFV